ncbi:hypothetical protein AVEN_109423-1 [Araneus ventricosus]|uniref:Tc1-like transposase DDE domain-containing protein n=1 Tax=Araneus ventricosus TaxID=182803 RepID=A0A4Y2KYT7_ARAVE|nr:hypothetical protein AVEN_16389-1 [Araneus ventricosus]GBN06767.1 hypothetical protein AVEN_72261-1 [Araneus ventricosus]GBN07721.1 hypothetical protein AVEN_57795-1 [Araneus ventricosus]GBN10692.1 hypothetical protein AVEN_109423-1 [Araneus ventricosus]
MQIVQELPQRFAFAAEMLSRIENEHYFLNRVIFSDEAAFHVSNKENISTTGRIWGSENPRAVQEVERNSPKINVWCALLHDAAIGPFFFAETSVTAKIYLDMLQIYSIPQMQLLQRTDIFHQDAVARMLEHFAGTTGQDYRLDILRVTKGDHRKVH